PGGRPPAEPDGHDVGRGLLAGVDVVEVGVPVVVPHGRRRDDAVVEAGGVEGELGGGERHHGPVGVAAGNRLAEPLGAGVLGTGRQEGHGAAGPLGHQVALQVGVDGRGGEEQPSARAPAEAGGGGGAAPGDVGRDRQRHGGHV